ncbi:MAG: biotin--[acetyl-CoA-carboxylase] ligase [Bacilli bacterium]|nr:biotin--[acetyl-CoA-carboxylase] ligase [Bacilli bacterium]
MRIDFNQYVMEFDVIDSTNDYLKQHYQQLPNFTIVKANYQTNGHGQFGRIWESQYGENLLFSLLIKKDFPFLLKDINPIIVGSIFNVLDEFGIDGRYKYPNDIYVGNKKIAGILIETKFDNQELEYMVIGIGLNVNQESFIFEEAISLRNILNKDLDINYVFQRLLKHLSNNVLLANLMKLGDEGEY